MTRDETKTLLKTILLAYPNFDISAEKVDLWAKMLTDVTFANAERNTLQHIKTSRYAPTIAEIRAGSYAAPGEDPQIAELRRRMGE